MRNVERKVRSDGYPVADDVMRGGILLACHHGLTTAQLDYVHESFRQFAKGFLPARRAAGHVLQSAVPAG
jgi:CDP-6-deoxy-D-xylo-4-hexulose-3-dehydrase